MKKDEAFSSTAKVEMKKYDFSSSRAKTFTLML
jgi:hypothetical protein